ncbi:hypothetical protein [Brucella anthropi]|uniref:hypothetical protein n=1 Tax=Brucella anthropi TaxID=529 RepID=UPI003988437A
MTATPCNIIVYDFSIEGVSGNSVSFERGNEVNIYISFSICDNTGAIVSPQNKNIEVSVINYYTQEDDYNGLNIVQKSDKVPDGNLNGSYYKVFTVSGGNDVSLKSLTIGYKITLSDSVYTGEAISAASRGAQNYIAIQSFSSK